MRRVSAVGAITVFAASVAAVAWTTSADAPAPEPVTANTAGSNLTDATGAERDAATRSAARDRRARSRAVRREAAPAPTAPAPAAPAPAPSGALCIGDSVMLGASPQYHGTLAMCAVVDADVSRQVSDGPAVLQAHAPYPSIVVIHLGTNGTAGAADLDAMVGPLQGVATVVLVTVQLHETRSWEGQVNAEVTAAVQRWPHARLADWKTASNGHAEFFATDGFHLSAAGAAAYAATIAAAL